VLRANPECELAAICDTNTEAVETAVEYNVPFYQNHDDLLAEQFLDGVIIATPTNLHVPVGIACAKRGAHILVEKPIAGTLSAARELVDTAERHGVQLLVGHHRRHNPLIQQVRQIVQGGQIGDLVGATAVFALLKPDEYFNTTWRTQPGGGPILTNLIHDIDNLRFICGEIERVFALTSSKTRGFEVEDSASVTIKFANGALGSVFVSDATPAPWAYELTSGENPTYPQVAQDCYHFLGTKGSLAFPSMTLWNYSNPETQGWWVPMDRKKIGVQFADPLTAQLAHFCRVIWGVERPLVSGQEGINTLAVIQAVLYSAQYQVSVFPRAESSGAMETVALE
jgi:predicted dehydrogenase